MLLSNMETFMTIEEAAKKSGLTVAAIYKQIREQRALGVHFKRNTMGKLEIDGRLVKRVK